MAARNYAVCVVNKRGSNVLTYLDASTPEALMKASKTLFTELSCLNLAEVNDTSIGARIEIANDLQRGLLAEAAFEEFGRDAVIVPLAPEKSYDRAWFPLSGRAPEINAMSVCVGDAAPQAIRALLKTQSGSQNEMSAISNLSPSLGDCLVKGATLHADRPGLRAALAEALYHRWRDTTLPATASAK